MNSVNQLIQVNLSFNQSINQKINKSMKQLINQLTNQFYWIELNSIQFNKLESDK